MCDARWSRILSDDPRLWVCINSVCQLRARESADLFCVDLWGSRASAQRGTNSIHVTLICAVADVRNSRSSCNHFTVEKVPSKKHPHDFDRHVTLREFPVRFGYCQIHILCRLGEVAFYLCNSLFNFLFFTSIQMNIHSKSMIVFLGIHFEPSELYPEFRFQLKFQYHFVFAEMNLSSSIVSVLFIEQLFRIHKLSVSLNYSNLFVRNIVETIKKIHDLKWKASVRVWRDILICFSCVFTKSDVWKIKNFAASSHLRQSDNSDFSSTTPNNITKNYQFISRRISRHTNIFSKCVQQLFRFFWYVSISDSVIQSFFRIDTSWTHSIMHIYLLHVSRLVCNFFWTHWLCLETIFI